MNFTDPRKVFLGLTGIIFILLILNIASYLNFFLNDLTPRDYFFKKTNFNTEKNLPSIFSGTIHFIAAFYLLIVATANLKIKKRKRFWMTLSLIFLFLGLDEILRIHEKISGDSSYLSENFGIFLYSWIVYYGSALVLLVILFFKPLFSLPRATLLRFIAAGSIFVTGAIGMENFAGFIIATHELPESEIIHSPLIFSLYTIEELLEMMGVAYFIYAVLKFYSSYKLPVELARANY